MVIYDQDSLIYCDQLFPDHKSFIKSRLNESVYHLEGAYIKLLDPIDAILQTVVDAEAAACIKIKELVKSVPGKQDIKSPLNESVFHWGGTYIKLLDHLDGPLLTVVNAKAAACIKITKLVKSVPVE